MKNVFQRIEGAWGNRREIEHIKKGLLDLCRQKIRAPEDMIQVSDHSIDMRTPDKTKEGMEKAAKWTTVLREFLREHPEYAVVTWSGKPALTWSAAVKGQMAAYYERNKNEGFVLFNGDL